MLHAYVVRSAHAHAKILNIDTSAAKRSPGVVDVITFQDLGAVRKFPLTIPHPNLKPLTEFPLARDKVRYVGEPVAVIVATSRQLAEDAAQLVQVDYEPMAILAWTSRKRCRLARRWFTKVNRITSADS